MALFGYNLELKIDLAQIAHAAQASWLSREWLAPEQERQAH